MLDIYLACRLLESVKEGAQLVLVGDAEQLPSVGPGTVLSEMLVSCCIPFVRLDKVFRQNAGSRIAINANLIRHGALHLEYGEDFRFIESPDLGERRALCISIQKNDTEKRGTCLAHRLKELDINERI